MPTEELLKKTLLMQKRLLDGHKTHNRCWLQRVKEVILETAYGAKIWGERLASSGILAHRLTVSARHGELGIMHAIKIPWEAKLNFKEALTIRARSN